eukprot:5704789-Pleurochrysis_carterae.AAC.1
MRVRRLQGVRRTRCQGEQCAQASTPPSVGARHGLNAWKIPCRKGSRHEESPLASHYVVNSWA